MNWSQHQSNAADNEPAAEAAPIALESLRALDPDAWEALYRNGRPTLWRFARLRLATAEQAEDAVSETMVRAMAAIGRYRSRGNPTIAWLLGIERNVVNEMYRAGARLRAVPSRPDQTPEEADDRLVADEETLSVRRAFNSLTSDEQELLTLRVIADLDADSAALVLGKRPGAVRMAQSRALGRMRVMLVSGDR